MKPPNWSLRTLVIAVLVTAAALAMLRHPTEDVAFAAGMGLSFALVVAVAIAIGAKGSGRSSCAAFAVVCALVLHQNDGERKLLSRLPSYSHTAANWLNEQFGVAEWKGPPRSFVYWADSGRVRYVSFNDQGDLRSMGDMSWSEAERTLSDAISLPKLPTEFPLPRPSLEFLADIVGLIGAFVTGLLAACLASRASKQTGISRHTDAEEADERRSG